MSELDAIVKTSLRSFFRNICSDWCGRENEAVSLYAFGHLAKEVRAGSALYDLTQIGIEVAVRQLRRKKFKGKVRTVRKDLVIWPTPGMTLWKAIAIHNGTLAVMEVHNEPSAVMEWKVNHYLNRKASRKNRREHRGDVRWLCVTSRRPDMADFVGYAVMLENWRTARLLDCVRVQAGVVDRQFLTLSEGDASKVPLV